MHDIRQCSGHQMEGINGINFKPSMDPSDFICGDLTNGLHCNSEWELVIFQQPKYDISDVFSVKFLLIAATILWSYLY